MACATTPLTIRSAHAQTTPAYTAGLRPMTICPLARVTITEQDQAALSPGQADPISTTRVILSTRLSIPYPITLLLHRFLFLLAQILVLRLHAVPRQGLQAQVLRHPFRLRGRVVQILHMTPVCIKA